MIYWTASISRFKKRGVYQTFTIKNFLLFSFHNIVNLLPFSKIALLLWNVQFISAIVFFFRDFKINLDNLAIWNGVWVIPSVTNNDRLFSYIRKIRFAGNASRDVLVSLDRARLLTRRGYSPTKYSRRYLEIRDWKFRVDRSRKSTTRQSREIKIVGSLFWSYRVLKLIKHILSVLSQRKFLICHSFKYNITLNKI